MSGSIFDTSLFDLAQPVQRRTSSSSFFSPSPGSAAGAIRSKKSLPFPLPDPYADDATFEIYDPRGLFKRREGSTSTAGSEEGSVGSRSRESSLGLGTSSERARMLGMSAARGRSEDSNSDAGDRVPSLSPSLKDEPVSATVSLSPSLLTRLEWDI